MLDCKVMATPMDTNLMLLFNGTSELVGMAHYRQIIGSLMYLTNTWLDICCTVNTLSQYLVKPRWVHLIAAKNVMMYLKGTIDLALYYGRDHDYKLYGYTYSYWEGSVTYRKSTSGGCYFLGSAMISLFSKKQSSVALSTVEAEYIADFSTCCEVIWLRKLMSRLFDMELDTTVILCDNQSCIKMTDNSVFHDKLKHIEIRYFYM